MDEARSGCGTVKRWLSFIAFIALIVVALAATTSCKKPKADAAAPSDESSSLPRVDDAKEGLLFTWIDARGEFHVEEKAASVPLAGRDIVRVVDPTKEDPPGRIFLADLRNTKPDGTYAVRSAPRAEFDKVAEERRVKAGLTTLASASGAPAASTAPGTPGARGPAANSASSVIVYGASWCGPCHQAQAHLKQKGVAFVAKDIEADSGAQREMQAKLAKAGKSGGSIPVIDVRGRILVGYSPSALDAALGAPL